MEDTDEEIRQVLLEAQHSRIPVIEGDADNVLGVLYTKDLVVRHLKGEPFDVRATLRPVLFVPESMSTLRVLELFKMEGNHIALVTDEYGSVQGMVTDMDILEAIVGAILPKASPRSRGSSYAMIGRGSSMGCCALTVSGNCLTLTRR